MQTNEYLFPHRLTRRDFMKCAGVAVAGFAAPGLGHAAETKSPARIGSGAQTYELVEEWGRLPVGMKYGFGCGVVVDSRDRVYVTSRSTTPCVAVFDRHGKLLETWSSDFADKVGYTADQVKDTAHCIYWSKEGKNEFLYVIGNVDKEGSTSQKFEWTNPTDVAVAANGDIYVVDGYGSQRVSRFDRNFKHIKTIGERTEKSAVGPNAPHGTFNTCHGVWINTLRSEPEVFIADRHNDRLEVYSLELEYKRTLAGDVRNPCCFYQHKDKLYVPDLASRVTILDADGKLVAHLGDGREADGKTNKPDNKSNPAMFAAPHAMCVDSHGDLYVVEWVDFGRARKFKHVKA